VPHCAWIVHIVPTANSQAPEPLHSFAGHSLSGSVFAVTDPQVPFVPPVFAALHAWHVPLHVESQQNESMQLLLMHCVAIAHIAPLLASHAPAPLHSPPAHSASGSAFDAMKEQVPLTPPVFAALHAWHDPVHAALQQIPSAQNPLKHSVASVHVSPVSFLHVPAASQIEPIEHRSCWPAKSGEHTPATLLHD